MPSLLAPDSLRDSSSTVFSPLTDEVLVARIRAGETELFEHLVRRYNQRLFRVARSFVGEAEAEDVMQEAFVRAFRGLGGFAGRSSFATWLTKIAVYEAMARARKRGRFLGLDERTVERASAGPLFATSTADPERSASDAELQRILGEAITELATAQRSVFLLRDVEGLSTAETAECLGISAENVKVRLHRARSGLRARLDHRLRAELHNLFSFGHERCDGMVARVLERLGLDPRRAADRP